VDVRTFSKLADELPALFARGPAGALDDEEFDALAVRAFHHQVDANPTYRAFCASRGALGAATWRDVPAVPATAFKRLDLLSADRAEAVFLTSGTSAGPGGRGRHMVPSLALYRASLIPNFRAALLPEGERLPLLSLIPPPSAVPDSSLSTMVGAVADELCDGATWLVDADGRMDVEGFLTAAAELDDRGRPALVTGTAFAFVHLLDALAARNARVSLPEGTRVMETGGFKGRSRVLERDALYAAMEARLGVPPARVVNEYGMTELLSQLYEPVLREGAGARGRHAPPWWLRVRALDPATLAPLPEGTPGLLAFFDLANLGSVCHILTEDVGTVSADGVRLHGRVVGAEPRGCSRAMEELMTLAGRRA
jgi:Acyl-protein synthetase, LuxE